MPLLAAGIGLTIFCATVSLPSWRSGLRSPGLDVGRGLALPSLVGALAANRRPRNSVGWRLLAIGLTGMASQAAYADNPGPHLSVPEALLLGLGNPLLYLSLLGASVLILAFPSRTLAAGPQRRVLNGAAVGYLMVLLSFFVAPTLSGDARNYANPLRLQTFAGAIDGLTTGITVASLVLLLLVVADAIRRQRQSRRVQRQQFRWLAYASVLLSAAMVVAVGPFGSSWWSPLALVIATNGIAASICLAVVRYRLYDIDRLVSRTVSYLIVVGFLTA